MLSCVSGRGPTTARQAVVAVRLCVVERVVLDQRPLVVAYTVRAQTSRRRLLMVQRAEGVVRRLFAFASPMLNETSVRRRQPLSADYYAHR